MLDTARILKNLNRIKWYLWHGNVYQALKRIESLRMGFGGLGRRQRNVRNCCDAVREFVHYIEANQRRSPNYGDRYRHGETISTSFVESAVNQVVSRRMVKRQQMVRRDKPAWSRG